MRKTTSAFGQTLDRSINPLTWEVNAVYAADWGMFHFCVAASEMDWRQGSEQYKFLEECFASVDRKKQPWLVFVAHRILDYSSTEEYQLLGSFSEPMSRENLQPLWQKYNVDLGNYDYVHNYE
ncbi:hypothetical protein Mapa_013884 [Marchantia paleacea]|nr:hypothetical protein Mapa_013884 [Marchantia paleacea]